MRVLMGLSLAILVSLNLSCNSYARKHPANAAMTTIVELHPVVVTLGEKSSATLEVATTTVGSRTKLQDAHFVDAVNGWIRSAQFIYRTSNGGKTWQPSRPNLEDTALINSISFVDPNHGWLTVTDQLKGKDWGRGTFSVIMVTSDGGETWNPQFTFKDEVTLTDISFLDADRGIAVGHKLSGNDGFRGELFAVSTTDGGTTWIDIGEHIKAGILTNYGLGADAGRKVYWLSS